MHRCGLFLVLFFDNFLLSNARKEPLLLLGGLLLLVVNVSTSL